MDDDDLERFSSYFGGFGDRSVLHRATAGYDGYDRELHRTTIA